MTTVVRLSRFKCWLHLIIEASLKEEELKRRMRRNEKMQLYNLKLPRAILTCVHAAALQLALLAPEGEKKKV